MPRDAYYNSPEWQAIRRAVRKRSGGKCEVRGCNECAAVCDHIISRKRGGRDSVANARDLCRSHDSAIKEDRRGNRKAGGKLYVKGSAPDGMPLDPNHPWSREG